MGCLDGLGGRICNSLSLSPTLGVEITKNK